MRKNASNANGKKSESMILSFALLCFSGCSSQDSNRINDKPKYQINNIENIKFSDKKFPVWAINEIHPNKVPGFYLFVEYSYGLGFYSNSTVQHLIGNTYQELSFHVELTHHIGNGFPHYPPGTESLIRSRTVASEQLVLARRLANTGKLTKTERSNIAKLLAAHITAWSRHWKWNGEWLTGSDLSRLGYSDDNFEHLPKPTHDSIEAANCMISWSIGETEIRPNR